MVLPEGQEAREEVASAKQRAVRGLCGSERDVIAAPGARVGSVELEGLGPEAGQAGLAVDRVGDVDEFVPCRGRLHVHFQHPGVGSDDEVLHTGIARNAVALQHHRKLQSARGAFDDVEKGDAVFELGQRRQEDEDVPTSGLYRQGRGRCLLNGDDVGRLDRRRGGRVRGRRARRGKGGALGERRDVRIGVGRRPGQCVERKP